MSLVKFETEMDNKQFSKFAEFMTWLKNDKNYKDNTDIVNKNDLEEDIQLLAIDNYYGERQELTKHNQYQFIAQYNDRIAVVNDWGFMGVYDKKNFNV